MYRTLFFLCLLLTFSAKGQEQLILRTDRDYYVGGEEAWISITNVFSKSNKHSDLSKVAYLELLNKEFKPVLQTKFRLVGGEVTSVVILPDTISTGNYTFRVYTRWMQNQTDHVYTYKTISVINPFAKNALPEYDDPNLVKEQNGRDSIDKKLCRVAPIKLVLKDTRYRNRDKVKLAWSIDTTLSEEFKYFTVSVIKSALVYDNTYHPSDIYAEKGENNTPVPINNATEIKLPELEGEWLTGTITDNESGKNISKEKMVLSFVGNSPIMKFSTTDSMGRFRFIVNKYGKKEMVIQPFHLDTANINYKVTLDPSFSEQYPNTLLDKLVLSKEKALDLNKAIINMQINTIYSSFKPELFLKDSVETDLAFYGKPELKVTIDKFIDLPNVEEVIKEIVPYATIRKQKNQYSFKVYEARSYFPRDGETLTLVDGVPIYNINSVLAINPEDLNRIEVVNLNYYLEDETLGRLLCFFTNEGNMGAMDFDPRIFRQARECYHPSYSYVIPDYSSPEKRKSRLADFRNVLYFGTINDSENNSGELNFYTGDDKGDYTVVIEAIDSKGNIQRNTTSFEVW